MNKQILIIGIDGGTWSVLQPAIDQGYMPHLKDLMESGASGVLESTIPAITPAAWGGFQTGMNPGELGVVHFSQWDKATKRNFLSNSQNLRQTIWATAGNAGKRVAVMNVPMTYPPKKINGYMVSGILTPTLDSEFTYPPELKDELLQAVPNYNILTLKNIRNAYPYANPEGFVQEMAEIIRHQTAAAKWIIAKEPFDLCMIHFQVSDVVQHALWPHLDKNHPAHDPDKQQLIFEQIYQLLDQKIDEIRQAFAKTVSKDFLTIVLSDHGFETHYKQFFLGDWLCRNGYLKLNPHSPRTPLKKTLKKFTSTLRVGKWLNHLISHKLASKVERTLGFQYQLIDWEQTTVFSQGTNGEGFIYLLEEDPAKCRKITKELIEKLKKITDPENGHLVIANVHRKEDIYRGRSFDVMPDLIVVPSETYSIGPHDRYIKNTDLFHKVSLKDEIQIGKHHKDGIVVFSGSEIVAQSDIRAQITDMAPTILYYLGLAIRPDFDGSVIKEIFPNQFLNKNPVEYSAPIPSGEETTATSKTVFSEKDENAIEQRLKDLGYL